jgi:hypothetical protein
VSAIPGFPQKNNAEVGFGRWWIAPTRWGNSNRTGDSGPMAGSRASIRIVHNRTVLGFATKMKKITSAISMRTYTGRRRLRL